MGILLIFITIFYLFVYKGEAVAHYVFKDVIGSKLITTSNKIYLEGISHPEIIVIDKQDNKYFTKDYATIVKYDANDNFVLSFGGYGTSSDKFGYVSNMALDEQGNLYVVDNNWDYDLNRNLPKVKKFDSNGNFIMSFGEYGILDGQFDYPWGIAIEPSTGNIYIGNAGTTREIQIYSPSGTFISRFGSQGDSDGLFQNPSGLTFDRNGDLHVVDYSRRYIQKFSSTTHAFMSAFGTPGLVDGGFYHPTNMALDSEGNFWISDAGQNRVQKFSSTTNAFLFKFGTFGAVDGQINNGYGQIAIDSQDNIYLVEYNNGRVSKFDKNGNFIKKFYSSQAGANDGEFIGPLGIAIDSNKNIFIAESSANNRVQKFDSNGNSVSKFGSSGSGDGQFNNINGIAVDTEDNVYVIDSSNGRVQKFDNNGNFLLKFGTQGSGNGQLSGPSAIAVDPSTNNVYVSDTYGGNARVAVFDQNGNFIRNFGGPGRGNGQFDKPMGITITSQGYVYVFNQNWYDDYNYHIQKFTLNGTFVAKKTLNNYYDVNSEESIYPWIWVAYMTSDQAGNLYFADYYRQRVVKFDSNMNFVSSVSTSDKNFSPSAVAFNNADTFYLTSVERNNTAIDPVTPLLIPSPPTPIPPPTSYVSTIVKSARSTGCTRRRTASLASAGLGP